MSKERGISDRRASGTTGPNRGAPRVASDEDGGRPFDDAAARRLRDRRRHGPALPGGKAKAAQPPRSAGGRVTPATSSTDDWWRPAPVDRRS